MSTAHYLIIGGGIAGTSAAETIRKQDTEGVIWIVDAEPHRLYSRVLLTHYVKGLIPENKLYLRTGEWYKDLHLVLKSNTRVVNLEPINHLATLSNGEVIQYKKLLIATGGTPRPWEVPGSKRYGVLPFWTFEQALSLKELMQTAHAVVVIGGGFIMADLVSLFHKADLSTHVIIRRPHLFWNTMDQEMANHLHSRLLRSGILIYPNSEVIQVMGDMRVTGVQTNFGRKLPCQIVGLGIGLTNELSFLKGTGVSAGDGIQTNEYLEANVPDIYAAGDVAESFDPILGLWHQVGNWTNAQEQGKTAGGNMAGEERKPFSLVTAYALSLLDTNLAFVGDFQAKRTAVLMRGDPKLGRAARLLIYKNCLIGAVLLNCGELRQPLMELIAKHVDISACHAILMDEKSDLYNLLSKD